MKKLLKDTNAFKDPLNELGWKNSNFKDYEDQRDYLKKNNENSFCGARIWCAT